MGYIFGGEYPALFGVINKTQAIVAGVCERLMVKQGCLDWVKSRYNGGGGRELKRKAANVFKNRKTGWHRKKSQVNCGEKESSIPAALKKRKKMARSCFFRRKWKWRKQGTDSQESPMFPGEKGAMHCPATSPFSKGGLS